MIEQVGMMWEWEYQSGGGRWVMIVGGWHAVVLRLVPSREQWQATLERTTAPHERHVSPPFAEAVDARA